MITVHHLEHSRSQRVLWLLEELGVDYRVEHYARNPKSKLAPKSLREVHRLGKSPVITDGELTLAESGAIIEYLADQYGRGRFAPAIGSAERAPYLYWLHYAEGSLMPILLMRMVFDKLSRPPMPVVMRPVGWTVAAGVKGQFLNPRLGEQLDFVEEALTDKRFFVADTFTAADVQMSFPLEAVATQKGIARRYPNIMAYLERIHTRDGYQRALERGGPFDLASLA